MISVKRMIKRILAMGLIIQVLGAGGYILHAENIVQNQAYVIIIIDDWGNNMAGSEEILKLPIPLTGAVIPGMPFDKQDAQKLNQADKEVMLHIPLEPEKGKKNWLGPKGITVGMTQKQILDILSEAKKDMPSAKGINNHMGSKAMKDEVIVQSLMKFAAENNLYFVDSGTTESKLSEKYSRENNLPFLKRSVFLDNTPSVEHVKCKLRELEEVAKEKGYAIGIGHVGPQKGPHTAKALKEMIPQMEKDGVRFITVSQLLEMKRGKK